jgi:hypothetical protein
MRKLLCAVVTACCALSIGLMDSASALAVPAPPRQAAPQAYAGTMPLAALPTKEHASAAAPAQMPEAVWTRTGYQPTAEQLAAAPAGWDFNWYSYRDEFAMCGSYQCAKFVVAVEQYRAYENGPVIYQRGYASVRNLGHGITGVKVTRSAYGYDGGATITQNTKEALDGGTCCATSRTLLVGVYECSFCNAFRGAGNFAIRYNNGLLYAYYWLSYATERNFHLG